MELDAIRSALAELGAAEPTPSPALAAVALVLAGAPASLELCFILRATRAGDRWSGQMALPGGRAETYDTDARAVAMRETHEEVGVKLHRAQALGALPPLPLRPGGGKLHQLSAISFYAGDPRPSLLPNADEVADTFWIPLSHLWDPAQRTTIDYVHEGQPMRFAGIRYRDQTIWGLTYRVLTMWAEHLGRPLPGGGQGPFARTR